ncbi:hypothetical protein ABMA32_12530 [Mesorhizobium sp. VNQ89]|uniref:hypothetical protein n=1 Tax=Mesorhizobium quangtriensis TaxID=3157709 RepID=UPI0032B77FFE
MFTRFKAAALSALIGLGALAAVPAAAQAQGAYLEYDAGNGVGIGMEFGGYDRADYRHGPRWDDRRDDRWDRRDDRRYDRRCSPDRAVDKAERYGLRRARVVDVSHRTITVAGRKWGERVHMTFARAPNCPIVRW